MTKIFQTFSLTILIALSSSFSYAIEEEKNELSLQEEITEYINHHVQDSHDFSLFSTKDKKVKNLMKSIDYTNYRYGRSTLSLADAGLNKKWNMRRKYSSKIDTANYDCLPIVKVS